MHLNALCTPMTAPGTGAIRTNTRRQAKKLLLIMKFSAIFLFLISLHVGAKGHTQLITIHEKNASLLTVFKSIEKQTSYRFFYNDKLIKDARKVSLNMKQAALEEVLAVCFKGQPFTYAIVEQTIVIRNEDDLPFDLTSTPFPPEPPPVDVQGRVINEKGEPVEGVTVAVKGTRKATFTDVNGNFTLSKVNERATLVFTGVQVNTHEVTLDGNTNLEVRLTTRITAMQDLILSANTGFQTISKERATGAYATVGKEQLEKPSTSIAQRIIGTTAGVQAKLDVNGNPTFEIRGLTSLYNPSQPLVVVDGFPIQGDFNSINPNDVESVTILKDAAAASIWGARSANGVIVVVTKRVKKNVPLRVEFSAFTRIGKKFDLDYVRPLASSAETVDYEKNDL